MIVDSLRKLAGQAIVAGFPEGDPPAALLTAAARGELGGFILFRRNLGPAPAVVELAERLVAAFPPGLPPFLGVDQEGGRVQRFGPPVLQLPPMRALGRVDRPDLTEQLAACLGAELAALGFNVDFAPVLDVDTHPDSPIIGDRSFGAEPDRVIRHGRAIARGLQRAGVAACGKHFPGHGDAALDSHLALPRVGHDRRRLDGVELAPFRALASELSAIMTAHIVFDALEPDVPATLSRVAIQQLLRGELGFGGVVFSDDLRMKAIADHYGIPEAGCEAIAAGCDTLLVCDEPELSLQVHEALLRRAEREPRFADRLRESAARSLAVRRAYPPRPVKPDEITARLASPAAVALHERMRDALARDAPQGPSGARG
jgi:beta-N-acetylhexosaminidase